MLHVATLTNRQKNQFKIQFQTGGVFCGKKRSRLVIKQRISRLYINDYEELVSASPVLEQFHRQC